MAEVIAHYDYEVYMAVVSEERIREELFKCFKHDSYETIQMLWNFQFLLEYIFRTNIWLKPTIEQ